MTRYGGGEAPPMYNPEGEPNHENQDTRLGGKLRELQNARPYLEKEEYEKVKKDLIANFVGVALVAMPDLPLQHQQNESKKQKIVQFRVCDTS